MRREDAASQDDECGICLDPLCDQNVCTLPCGHVFHSACVLQAAVHDPRCPACRVELAKRPAPTVSVVDVTMDDLLQQRRSTGGEEEDEEEAARRERRRQQRNYDARRRRFVRKSQLLQREHARGTEAARALRSIEKRLEDQWHASTRALWTSPAFQTMKRERALLLRRVRRHRTVVDAAVVEALGERPESSSSDEEETDDEEEEDGRNDGVAERIQEAVARALSSLVERR